jgi:hypothetical protein
MPLLESFGSVLVSGGFGSLIFAFEWGELRLSDPVSVVLEGSRCWSVTRNGSPK